MPLKEALLLTVPKGRGHIMPCRATRGSTRVSQEAQGARGEYGPEPLLWFLWEEMGEAE